MSDNARNQPGKMLPPGIHGAGHLLAGYFGPVDLGGNVSAIPAEMALREDVEPEWRDDIVEWWLLFDDEFEYGYVPIGRREWMSDRELIWMVHNQINIARQGLDVLLNGGVENWFTYKNNQNEPEEFKRGGFW
jgi:hypothetical protein